MFGNILILITLIFYGVLANLLLRPKPGGDYGVGYSFALMIYAAGFLISTGLLAWNMNANQCLDWAPAAFLQYRNWLVFSGWISFVVSVLWSLEYHSKRVENELPKYLNLFTWSRVYIWLPLGMLIACLYLLNAQRLAGSAPLWVRISVQTGLSVSLLIALGILWAFFKFWVLRRVRMFQSRITHLAEGQADYKATLDYINNYKEATISNLLKFAHPKNDSQLRNAAIAKIKSFENWEKDLITILGQKDLDKIYVYEDNTRHVYAFLEYNKIENPEKFIQPLISSLHTLALRIRKSLNDPYDLELGLTDIEVVCRVFDAQFKDRISELKPSMVKLQQALGTTAPDRKNKTHLKSYNKELKQYRLAINNWLELNK